MNYAVEMDETAGQAEKNLPGDAFAPVFPAARTNVPNDAHSSLRRDVELSPLALNVASPDFRAQPEAKVESASPSMSDTAVDRVARVLLDGVARVRHMGRESVTVSITPQPGTEFLLRVEMREGALSAHLHFERGDRQLLDSNWQELQRRMADQGVQLHRDDGEARKGSSLFQQDFSQSQRREDVPREETISPTPQTRGAKVPNRMAAPRFSKSLLEGWA